MKKITTSVVLAILLSSCGGGGEGTGESTSNVNDTTNQNSCSDTKLESCTPQTSSRNIQAIPMARSANDPIAYGFDYPIGNRGFDGRGNTTEINERIPVYSTGYNASRNEEYNLGKGIVANNSRSGSRNYQNLNEWYNVNDVGNFYNGAGGYGVHPGEDWNLGAGDAGQAVYAIANGVVEEISSVGSTINNRGWKIIIRHRLPDDSYVYSIYLHVTSHDNNGTLTYNEGDFPFSEGDTVDKGDIIGSVATGMTAVPDHLHFEIRSNFTSGADLYANANRNGYYTHDESTHTSMTKSQIETSFQTMKDDGIFDPSDFIDDHRRIYPLVGNGSIISYHGEQRYLVSLDAEYPYGITQDVTHSHSHYQKQSGYFQWQASSSCSALEIDFNGTSNNTNITVGHWSNRNNDVTFKNVNLPFVIGESNMGVNFNYDGNDWYVVSVGLDSTASERISATCVNSYPSTHSGLTTRGDLVLIGEHQWNGNASIISRTFKEYSDVNSSNIDSWPFGAFKDVTFVHKSQYKPAIFYQWMSSEECKQITIDAPSLSSTEKQVTIGTKGWSSSNYSQYSTTLPATLSSSKVWTVIQVLFDNPVSESARVYARCSGY